MRVGIFDSGLGGLLTARYVRALHPQADILYYGDTAHLPYGDKSPAQIQSYVRSITAFLCAQGAELIAVACNTASSVAIEAVYDAAGTVPVLDAITPAVRAFQLHRYAEPVGVIGTYTTIRSGIYRTALEKLGYSVQDLATPLLVPLIEEGWLEHPATHAALDTYLSQISGIQTLLLACTHYPLIEPQIHAYYQHVGQKVEILNTAALLAEEIVRNLPPRGSGFFSCWLSDPNPRFLALAERFWEAPILPIPAPIA
ncbi:MAG: glutamate racemase [Bacteroidia bacterium]|nr:glutamate racemase [Bacteroidia bacterium]MDW8235107.1 glutamate racemase [Bacteroidia bacterium]